MDPCVFAYIYPCSFIHLWKLKVPCCSTNWVLQFWFKFWLIWWRGEREIWGRSIHVRVGFRVLLSCLCMVGGWRWRGGRAWLVVVVFVLLCLKKCDRLTYVYHIKRDIPSFYFIFIFLTVTWTGSHAFVLSPPTCYGPFSC